MINTVIIIYEFYSEYLKRILNLLTRYAIFYCDALQDFLKYFMYLYRMQKSHVSDSVSACNELLDIVKH